MGNTYGYTSWYSTSELDQTCAFKNEHYPHAMSTWNWKLVNIQKHSRQHWWNEEPEERPTGLSERLGLTAPPRTQLTLSGYPPTASRDST